MPHIVSWKWSVESAIKAYVFNRELKFAGTGGPGTSLGSLMVEVPYI